MYDVNKEAVCNAIYSTNVKDKHGKDNPALKFDKMILTSGKFSIFYIDHRAIMGDPYNADIILNELENLALDAQPDHIISSATAGIYWGGVIANRHNLPFSVMRKDVDSKTNINKHMGVIPESVDNIVPVDDLNTTLGTVNKVIGLVNHLGYPVENYILSIDREEYTSENLRTFKKFGTNISSAVTGIELIEHGFENNKISEDKADMTESYRKNPDEFAIKIITENPEWVKNHNRLDKAKNYYKDNRKVREALEEVIFNN